VARAAAQGQRPQLRYEPEDLAWAFEGREAELHALEAEAEQAVERDRARQRTADDRIALVAMTDRVLAEWDAERRRDAEAEARRRLGMEASET
jgi:hypothetical protein